MLKDKYNMTTEENVLYAKRNIVDSIWKSANLEGISVTFSEVQAIYDGANVGHLRIDEIQAINNLKHAWQFVIYSINTPIDLKFIHYQIVQFIVYVEKKQYLCTRKRTEAPVRITIYDLRFTIWSIESKLSTLI